MKKIFALVTLLFICISVSNITAQSNEKLISPKEYFGFQPGTDRMLLDYEELIGYLKKLEETSSCLKLEKIGTSQMGRDMYVALISSKENIANIPRLKEINKKLALDHYISIDDRKEFIDEGKVFVLATLSMHSSEVGPAQSASLMAYNLLSATDKETTSWLNNVVFVMVPCHNPDGMDMVVNHYKKYKGTKYEGANLPGVYHKYIGHNVNRDFVTLSQSETKAISSIWNSEWYPQVMVEKHQMGITGVRYFVPPPHDPIAENVDAGIWNWMNVFGTNMVKDMTKQGLRGITQNYLFDDYWPGSTETCIWQNVIGFLTEAASVQGAKPVYIEPGEIRVTGKGLAENEKSIKMTLPWEGGWWRLGDIVKYELASIMSIIRTASENKEEIMQFINDLCKKEVEKGKSEAPYFYVLPKDQHDVGEFVNLVNLLLEHKINVYEMKVPLTFEGHDFLEGDIVVPLSQPFRPLIKEIMEKQKFPLRHFRKGGEIIKPYDITSWSLPLHKGVQSYEINEYRKIPKSGFKKIQEKYTLKDEIPEKYWAAVFNVNYNESFEAVFTAIKLGMKPYRLQSDLLVGNKKFPKGSFLIYTDEGIKKLVMGLDVSPFFIEQKMDVNVSFVNMPRIALVETYFHDMDAGWARFIFDNYTIPYKVVRPGEIETMDLSKEYDVVIFPDAGKTKLLKGKEEERMYNRLSDYPPEYQKRMNEKSMQVLASFIDNGGTIIAWGGSAELFTEKLVIDKGKDNKEEFQLPVRDISERLKKAGLYCPGSLVRLELKKDHPITLGMKNETGIFYRGSPVFATSLPNFDMDRRVIGLFPEENILMSGYCEKENELIGKTGLVWLKKGKGQVVLFAFSPIFRSSTSANYKLVFNAILLPGLVSSH